MKKRPAYCMLQTCRIPLLLLYSLFFTVQVFFNFDTPSYGQHICQSNIAAQKKECQSVTHTAHANRGKQAHSKIRLNKRFQPSVAPDIQPFSIAAPVCFVHHPPVTGYRNPFYNSIQLLTRTLRGPPAVVYHSA